MSDELQPVYESIDEQHSHLPPSTRRKMIGMTAASLAGAGLLGIPGLAYASGSKRRRSGNPAARGFTRNDPQTILNTAATAEVLATIVNTVGAEKLANELDPVTLRNVRTAAREELIHYNVLVSDGVGGRPLTKRIWVPDAVFASPEGLLNTLEVGDQIFINAYLIGIKEYGFRGNGALAGIAAEFMGVEAVHRALARQSLGKLGNDRAFMRFDQPEEAADAPDAGRRGTSRIERIPGFLVAAGFGFGEKGASPGSFYNFDEVSRRTPEDDGVNTRMPDIE